MSRQSKGLRLHVDYMPWSSDDAVDGDVFEIALLRASGDVAASLVQTVRYTSNPPNPDGCGAPCPHAEYDLPDAGW